MSVASTPLLLRVREVAAELGLHEASVWRLIWKGELPVVRLGKAVRVPRVELERWVAERTVAWRPDEAEPAEPRPARRKGRRHGR